MNRMDNDSLTTTIARAMYEFEDRDRNGVEYDELPLKLRHILGAKALWVLAALGLDDLDAAAMRIARRRAGIDAGLDLRPPTRVVEAARADLEAALTATQAGQTDQEDFDARR